MKVLGPLAPLLRLRGVMAALDEEIAAARSRLDPAAGGLGGWTDRVRARLRSRGVSDATIRATLRTLEPLETADHVAALRDLVATFDVLEDLGQGGRITEIFAP